MEDYLPKIQFEVRYSNILNFATVLKETMTPFLKVASSFSIQNQGTYQERLKLTFEDNLTVFEIWWDRAFIVTEGPIKDFDGSSVLDLFFSALKKIFEFQPDSKLLIYIQQLIFIKRTSVGIEENLSLLKENCFSKSLNEQLSEAMDVGITIDYKLHENKMLQYSFGPYSKKDINEKGLYPFEKANRLKENKESGFILECNIKDDASSEILNSKTFMENVKLATEYGEKISRLWEH